MKIALKINNCNDCPHSVATLSTQSNSSHFLICTHTEDDNFLIMAANEPTRHFNVTIPEQCPLEDYKPNDDK